MIPTHDRPERLGRTLAAIEHQTLPREAFEVIVVDDGSAELNREALRRYAPPYAYTLIEQPCRGLASARNAGAARANGKIVYFLDDDVEPATATLEEHLASHAAAGEPVAVVGSLPYPPGLPPSTFRWYLERSGHFDLYRDPTKYPGGQPPLPPMNGNSSIPLELFQRTGAYDESFRRYGGEDLDLGYRLARQGIRFVYNPRAVGFHHHLKTFVRFCADQEAAGESLIELYRKHPEIKAAKKIDVVTDSFRELPWNKQRMKLVLGTMLRMPWALGLPRGMIRVAAPFWTLRAPLFPLYRLMGHYHYAVGMQRGLAGRKR